MEIGVPENLEVERVLWEALSQLVYDYKMPWETNIGIGEPWLERPFRYRTEAAQPPDQDKK